MAAELSKKSQGLIQLLEGTLSFNPYLRLTAAECLCNQVFDPVRDRLKERMIIRLRKNKVEAQ